MGHIGLGTDPAMEGGRKQLEDVEKRDKTIISVVGPHVI
jgi:hypothetical protein